MCWPSAQQSWPRTVPSFGSCRRSRPWAASASSARTRQAPSQRTVRAPSCAVRADGECRVKAQRFVLMRCDATTLAAAAAALAPAEMTAVYIQTASTLYSVSGVGYGPTGSITRTVAAAAAPPPPPAAAGSQDPKAAAVAAATAAMAAKGPASAVQSPVEHVELSEGELTALRALLEGAVLCNDSQLSTAQDEATGDEADPHRFDLHTVCVQHVQSMLLVEATCLSVQLVKPRQAQVNLGTSQLQALNCLLCACVTLRQDTVQAPGCPD